MLNNFEITGTKCMQNKNGLPICRIALQRKALLNFYKIPGPNPPGIRDLRQCSDFEVQKGPKEQLKFESVKPEYFNLCVNYRFK